MARRNVDGWSSRLSGSGVQAAASSADASRQTLADLLPILACENPERVLLVDREVQLTAVQLHAQAASLAGWLREQGQPGDVVSFVLPNWHEAAIVYLAATYAGMVINPILPSLRHRDLRFILEDCGSRVIFAPGRFRRFDYADMLRELASEMDAPPRIVTVRGGGSDAISLASILSDAAPAEPLSLDVNAVRMVMYTSGTTGTPKGVLHTHGSLHALLKQIGEHWLVEPGDVFLVPSPVSHIGGSIYAFEGPIMLGSTAILMDRWDPAEALEIMVSHDVTHMAGATPFLEHLLAAAVERDEHLPALKVFICGGASVPPLLIERAADWFANARVSRVYGSTEVPVTTVGALDRPGMAQAAQTDGRAGSGEIRISAEGEVLARGPQMMAGYIRSEDEADAFDADGFYRTGDQGVLDADGFLTITGRLKDLIIRNGENIAPKEIEDLLLAHPDIAEIAIVGLPDPMTGERACAVIVPKGDAAPDVRSIGEYLEQYRVAKFKYPERVELRDTLPRNDAGKVLKHVLRAQLAG